MNVLLVDDEPHNCDLIETLLNVHLQGEVNVVGHAYSVDEAIRMINNNQVDLVFLDIQMPEKNGFELLDYFESPSFEVIFITSFDQYALPAIKVNALEYLLKPVDVKELKHAVDKANKLLHLKHLSTLESQDQEIEQGRKIAVHDGDKVIYIRLSGVISFQADGRYTKIVTTGEQQFMIAKNLKIVEEQIVNNTHFIRINRSVILNSSFIVEYSKSEPFIISLSDGSSFEVSRRKRHELLTKLKSQRG